MNSLHRMQLRSAHLQRGINLIEIMVSMVIGLFLVLGATTLYINSKKSADVDDSIARLQETSRYALSILETDIRMANFWGLVKDGSNVTNRLQNINPTSTLTTGTNADNCGANYPLDAINPIVATNNSYPFSNTTCAAVNNAQASADTLTVRRASTTGTATAGTLQVCATRQSSTIISNGTCASQVFDLMTNIYYVAQGSAQSATLPSLRRKSLINGPAFQDQEIIPGIEDMQIELGWSNDASNSAAAVQYLQPGTAVANGQVVAVRLWLLVRAETQDFTYTDTKTYTYADRAGTATGTLTAGRPYAPNDNFQRLLVSRTFFIRNAAGTT
ncbi:MAG: PilW family protein [Steroidobacteraceae bacterium]